MKSSISPSIEQESALTPTVFMQTDSKILFCTLEKVFINPQTRQANEHIFLISPNSITCSKPAPDCFIDGVPPATSEVNKFSPQLLQAAVAVGRIFVQFTDSSYTLKFAIGTAFFVASGILAAAGHCLEEKAGLTLRFVYFTNNSYATVDDLERVLQEEGILSYNAVISTVEESRLNGKDYWMARRIPSKFPDETERVAYRTDKTPAGNKWPVRHDFAFLTCNMPTGIYFIPQAGLAPQDASVALIGYASSLDIEEISRKYEKDFYTPTLYSTRKVFTQFERKFLSPGIAKNRNEFLIEHTANAVASTSGGVVLDLSSKNHVDHQPFIFTGLHLGTREPSCNVFLHTRHKGFCLEWASLVLPAICKNPPTTPESKQALRAYVDYALTIAAPTAHSCIENLRQAANILV